MPATGYLSVRDTLFDFACGNNNFAIGTKYKIPKRYQRDSLRLRVGCLTSKLQTQHPILTEADYVFFT